MRYRADITAGSLKVPESRVLADLLIRGCEKMGLAPSSDRENPGKPRGAKVAETEQYLGREEMTEGLTLISALLAATDSVKFIERFNGRKNDLLVEAYDLLKAIYQERGYRAREPPG